MTIFVIFLIVGLAIDVGRAMHADRKVAAALDAASLAAAKGLRLQNMTDAEVRDVAHDYFYENMRGGGNYANLHDFLVTIDHSTNTVSISIQGEVPTLFGRVAGISEIALAKESSAIYDTKDIEIGLQLDVTGSMCSPCSKLAALKDAVAGTDGLLDILIPDGGTTNSVRIGLAPFAAGVNAGIYTSLVTDGRNPSDHCVYERKDLSFQPTDEAPIGTARFKVKSELSGASSCPGNSNGVVAMTNSKSTLRTAVQALTTSGSTAGHLGAAWAWGLVSPNWSSVWGGTAPAPYGDGHTQKYVILMTDGDYNTFAGKLNSTGVTLSNQNAQDTCDAMKTKGITVFTVGFQVGSSAKTRLQACASNTARYYDATDATTLRAAFRAIAQEINSLRLSS